MLTLFIITQDVSKSRRKQGSGVTESSPQREGELVEHKLLRLEE